MPWTRIEDDVLSHRKFDRISDRVLGFWLRGLLYAARNLTDGKLPQIFVRTKTQMAIADELVARELWTRTREGYEIHDFLDYHFSKQQIEEQRRQGRERQTRWRRGVTRNPAVTNGPISSSQGNTGQGTPLGALADEIEGAMG